MFRLQFPRLFALFFVCLIELSALSLGFSLLFGFFGVAGWLKSAESNNLLSNSR